MVIPTYISYSKNPYNAYSVAFHRYTTTIECLFVNAVPIIPLMVFSTYKMPIVLKTDFLRIVLKDIASTIFNRSNNIKGNTHKANEVKKLLPVTKENHKVPMI